MKFGAALKGLSGKVNSGYSKWKSEAPARDAARLSNLKSKATRDKEMSAIKKERLEARREVTQAQTALRRSQNEYKAAKGGGFNIDNILGKKKTQSVKRKYTPAKSVKRKYTPAKKVTKRAQVRRRIIKKVQHRRAVRREPSKGLFGV